MLFTAFFPQVKRERPYRKKSESQEDEDDGNEMLEVSFSTSSCLVYDPSCLAASNVYTLKEQKQM